MSVILALAAIAVFGFGWGIGNNHGYHKGQNAAAIARRKYLETRINGAARGVTKLSVEDYEQHALSTVASKIHDDPPRWFDHIKCKLGGEAGEFLEHVGKASRDDGWDMRDGPDAFTPERRAYLLKELGDLLWYIVALAAALKSNLAEIMLLNIQKRDARKKRGTLQGAGDDR